MSEYTNVSCTIKDRICKPNGVCNLETLVCECNPCYLDLGNDYEVCSWIQIEYWVLLIITIFGGICGCDQMIMGRIGLGLLKGFTFGGYLIWYIIDIIIMLADKHEEVYNYEYDVIC